MWRYKLNCLKNKLEKLNNFLEQNQDNLDKNIVEQIGYINFRYKKSINDLEYLSGQQVEEVLGNLSRIADDVSTKLSIQYS